MANTSLIITYSDPFLQGTTKYSSTLLEIDPLGLSKLGSILGSIERVFGLSNAVRIVNFKVSR